MAKGPYVTTFIESFLDEIRRPATTAEIRSALKENGFFIRNVSLNWALTNLNTAKRVRRVRRGIYESVRPDRPPKEPPAGPGPQYEPRDGKLSEVASLPKTDEAASQAHLHDILRSEAKALAASLVRVSNRFPELANAAARYANLLQPDVAEIDVTAVWSVGGSLASFAAAYREQNRNQTMSDPLEPAIDAQLQSIVRQHGALIMGFEQSRELVQRADQFAVGPIRLKEIAADGLPVLEELATNVDLVDEHTRAIHQTVLDGVVEFGWEFARGGYSAYLIIRNGVRAIIKFSIAVGVGAGTVAAISTLAGDPNAEFARVAIPILRNHGAQLLAFFAHSPEMQAYVDWALHTLKADKAPKK